MLPWQIWRRTGLDASALLKNYAHGRSAVDFISKLVCKFEDTLRFHLALSEVRLNVIPLMNKVALIWLHKRDKSPSSILSHLSYYLITFFCSLGDTVR